VSVNLGRLEAGQYKIDYALDENPPAAQNFLIDKASAVTIDSFNYASVTQINSKNIFPGDKAVNFKISGLLPSNCNRLVIPVKFERQNNVIVVLPVFTTLPNCKSTRAGEFNQVVSVGHLPEGTYLFHVRSLHGQVQTRLVAVQAAAAK
jgi:hypothetical protein